MSPHSRQKSTQNPKVACLPLPRDHRRAVQLSAQGVRRLRNARSVPTPSRLALPHIPTSDSAALPQRRCKYKRLPWVDRLGNIYDLEDPCARFTYTLLRTAGPCLQPPRPSRRREKRYPHRALYARSGVHTVARSGTQERVPPPIAGYLAGLPEAWNVHWLRPAAAYTGALNRMVHPCPSTVAPPPAHPRDEAQAPERQLAFAHRSRPTPSPGKPPAAQPPTNPSRLQDRFRPTRTKPCHRPHRQTQTPVRRLVGFLSAIWIRCLP